MQYGSPSDPCPGVHEARQCQAEATYVKTHFSFHHRPSVSLAKLYALAHLQSGYYVFDIVYD